LNLPDGVVANNIFYFRTAFSEAQDLTDVLSAIEEWVEAAYTTLIADTSDLVTFGETIVYEYDTVAMQWDNLGTATPAVTFTGISEMLPHGVAALVRAYSTQPRSIARKYLPGLVEEAQADGAWVATTLTALANFGNAWDNVKSISLGNELRPGVWSSKYGTIYLLSGDEVVLADPAYQRRRRPGVGS